VDGTEYVRGTAVALEYYVLDLSRAQAKRYAGEWIAIPKGDKLSPHGSVGLTVASLVEGAVPQYRFTGGGKLKLGRRVAHGTRLLVLQMTEEKLFEHRMTARASGTPLPVSFYDSCGFVCGTSGTFSKWNEPVHVKAPASSTPIATVRGFGRGQA
jgi:hypothetical protein